MGPLAAPSDRFPPDTRQWAFDDSSVGSEANVRVRRLRKQPFKTHPDGAAGEHTC